MLSSHKGFFVLNEGLPLGPYFAAAAKQPRELLDSSEMLKEFPRLRTTYDALAKSGLKRWGYKDPQLGEQMTQLRALLQEKANDYRCVIIVRDPRGVVNSYMTHKWGLGSNAYSGALRWLEQVGEQTRLAEDFPDATLVIRYEDLLEDTGPLLRRICKHISLDFDESMLAYYDTSPEYKINEENQHTNRPPDAGLATKWKHALNPRQVKVIEFVTRDLMDKYGYKRMHPLSPISTTSRLFYELHQKTVGEIQMQYRWRRAQIGRVLKSSTAQ